MPRARRVGEGTTLNSPWSRQSAHSVGLTRVIFERICSVRLQPDGQWRWGFLLVRLKPDTTVQLQSALSDTGMAYAAAVLTKRAGTIVSRTGERRGRGSADLTDDPCARVRRSGHVMSQLRAVPKQKWRGFFDAMSKELLGKRAEIEVASLDLGDQIVLDSAPMIGITYDSGDDLLDIALDGTNHMIRNPPRDRGRVRPLPPDP